MALNKVDINVQPKEEGYVPKSKKKTFSYIQVLPVVSFALALGIWWVIAELELIRLPTPAEVIMQLYVMATGTVAGQPLHFHVYMSLQRVLIAFVIALAVGIPLGTMMGWNRRIEKIFNPIFEIFRPIPPIAWVPLAILWMGIGEAPKIFIVWVGCFVPMVVNSFTGMRYADKLLMDASRTLGATRSQQFFNVALPAALPSIFAGVQNGLSLGWMCVLAAEMIAAREGAGFLILQGMYVRNEAMIVSGMLIIGLLGFLIAIFLRYMEKVITPWRKEELV